MITALLIWFYILLIAWSSGLFFINIFFPELKNKNISSLKFLPLILFSGLFFLMIGLGYLSLFLRINWESHLFIFCLSLFFLCRNFELSKRLFFGYLNQFSALALYKKVLLITIFFVVLFCTPVIPKETIIDNGLYYAQTIKWIENYPAVPGLGNLQGRYAFNSHWFLNNAFFSFSFFCGPFTLLNSLVFLIFCFYLVVGLPTKLKSAWQKLDLIKLLLIISAFFLLKNALNSAYPDLAVTLFCWLLCLIWLEGEWSALRFLFVVVAGYSLLTIKLSAWPVLIFVLFAQRKLSRDRTGIKYFILGGVVLLPWLLRNIILSGYLIYPWPELDLFNFDWKIPSALALAEKNAIIAWARVPYAEMSAVLALSFKEWFFRWLTGLSMIKKAMFAVLTGGSAGWFLFGVLSFKNISILYKKNIQYFETAALCLVGILYWFFTAPDFRFGYSFILIYCLLILLPLLWVIEKRTKLVSKGLLILIVLQAILFACAIVKNNNPFFYPVVPVGYPQPELKEVKVQGKLVYVPKSGQLTWDAPLPAAPFVNEGLTFRGDSLRAGFRMKRTGE